MKLCFLQKWFIIVSKKSTKIDKYAVHDAIMGSSKKSIIKIIIARKYIIYKHRIERVVFATFETLVEPF